MYVSLKIKKNTTTEKQKKKNTRQLKSNKINVKNYCEWISNEVQANCVCTQTAFEARLRGAFPFCSSIGHLKLRINKHSIASLRFISFKHKLLCMSACFSNVFPFPCWLHFKRSNVQATYENIRKHSHMHAHTRTFSLMWFTI